jgi:hypothetical protein
VEQVVLDGAVLVVGGAPYGRRGHGRGRVAGATDGTACVRTHLQRDQRSTLLLLICVQNTSIAISKQKIAIFCSTPS